MHATIDVRFTVSIDEDKTVPPNPVERLMGEVSKRCKNQWMRWTSEGLEALLQLRLVKYADPAYYESFLDKLL